MNLDWQAYFKAFCKVHSPDGKFVVYKADPETGQGGALLFADGWKYARHDRKGPEFPPPEDPETRLALIKEYWSIRLRTVKEELRATKQELIDMVQLQQRRSATICIVEERAIENDEGQVVGRETVRGPVDFDHLLDMVRQYQEEVRYCLTNLNSAIIPDTEQPTFIPAEILAQLNRIEV